MGLALAAMACARRGEWAWAGVLVTAAVLSQQFALLVAAPLLVLAPAPRRLRFVVAALGTAAVIAGPLLVLSSGSAIRALVLGSSDKNSGGGTVLWALGGHGTAAVLVSRILPILLALALAWWIVRRLGAASLEPTVIVSVVAVSLSLRLVFELSLFAYYFMALVVALVLLDVTRGHVRASLLAWLTTLTLVFCVGGYFNDVYLDIPGERALPLVAIVLALVTTVLSGLRGKRLRTWNLALCAAVVACGAVTWNASVNPATGIRRRGYCRSSLRAPAPPLEQRRS